MRPKENGMKPLQRFPIFFISAFFINNYSKAGLLNIKRVHNVRTSQKFDRIHNLDKHLTNQKKKIEKL